MMASIMGEHSRTQKNTSAIILSYTIVHDLESILKNNHSLPGRRRRRAHIARTVG